MPLGPTTALPPDVARDGWLPVTVQVAWTLVAERAPTDPDTICAAREHVLRSLPEGACVRDAERATPELVRDFLGRLGGGYQRCVPQAPPVAVDLSWRDELSASLDPLGDAVLRLHFGDRLSLEAIEAHIRVDRTALVAARCAVRALFRDIAGLHDMPDGALDCVLHELAALPAPGCPGPMGLLTEPGLRHADGCPRCSRAVRLLRGGHLRGEDLFVPRGGEALPPSRVEVVALLLHPDAARDLKRVQRALGARATMVEPGAWVMDESVFEAALPGLQAMCLEGRPARHHLRGACVRGAGRWMNGVVLGPTPLRALETARARPWSELAGLGELPAPLPPPPRATGWWMGASAVAALATLLTWATFRTPSVSPTTPVDAAFSETGAGWNVRFDAEDVAVVDVVVQDGTALRRQGRALRAAKGGWSTGQGDYALHVSGDRVVVIASPDGIAQLDAWIDEVGGGPEALDRLAERVGSDQPFADLALSPAKVRPPEI